jgi:hypothetical protein
LFRRNAVKPAGTPAPILQEAVLPDYFEVDHVRVFDQVGGETSADRKQTVI